VADDGARGRLCARGAALGNDGGATVLNRRDKVHRQVAVVQKLKVRQENSKQQTTTTTKTTATTTNK
jgi:hypothetical protein